jgi:hypothetical protein
LIKESNVIRSQAKERPLGEMSHMADLGLMAVKAADIKSL